MAKRTKIKDLLLNPQFGAETNVKGWVRTKRGNKNIAFIAINDGSTIHNIQAVADLEKVDEALIKLVTTGACISVTGEIVANEVSREAAARIVAIVTGLRSFARLDQAEMDTVSLEKGLKSTLNLVHHELKNRIEVTTNLVDLPPIECYPNQINQVFMNLLVNACQAIEGKGAIAIHGRTENGRIVLEFIDSGRGIDHEHLDRIFDPGFTTKGTGVGTGLGLSIVHQIIQKHRGTIEVTSEVGKGTTFQLSLPISSRKNETDRD